MVRKFLFMCGILASLLYAGADMLAAMRYAGYSYTGQAVSELFAIGAPTRSLIVPLFLTHGVLQIAFGWGVWMSARRRRGLRLTAGLLVGIGLVDLLGYFFPMHVRGAEFALTDTMHIILTTVIVLFTLLAIGLGANAFGRSFRLYSIATIVMVIGGGALAGANGARVAANLPTPWLGVMERISIYSYMLWMLVLALTLLRARDSADHSTGEATPQSSTPHRSAA